MDVQILNLKRGLVWGDADKINHVQVFLDPEKHYAVVEIHKNELYIALSVVSLTEQQLIGKYFDHYSNLDDTPMLMKFSVDWSCIRYGFCKLKEWAPEIDYYEKTVKRFYFDKELYEKSYEEINGVLYKGKHPGKDT